MFDGVLGIISAISAVKVLNVTGKLKTLRHPVEVSSNFYKENQVFDVYLSYICFILKVIAFSDEEGVRFQSTFLGSAAIAGVLPVSTLQIPDKRYSLFS